MKNPRIYLKYEDFPTLVWCPGLDSNQHILANAAT